MEKGAEINGEIVATMGAGDSMTKAAFFSAWVNPLGQDLIAVVFETIVSFLDLDGVTFFCIVVCGVDMDKYIYVGYLLRDCSIE